MYFQRVGAFKVFFWGCVSFFSGDGLFYVEFVLFSSLARRTEHYHATLIFSKLKPFTKHIIS